jgi:hypothetical protein
MKTVIAFFRSVGSPFCTILFAGLVLSGCASLSEQECRTADWRMIGYEDGVTGRQAGRLADHREACADHGITPDMESYRLGREEGLWEYCRPQNVYQLGLRGRAYPAVCPTGLEEALKPAYSSGRQIHETQSAIDKLRSILSRTEQELEDIKNDFANHQIQIVSDETSEDHRLRLLVESWELVKRRNVAEREIEHLQTKLTEEHELLENLESSNRYR